MIVVNATILSNLARVDRLGPLKELYGKEVIPIQVYEEVLKGINDGYNFLRKVDEIIEEDWTVFEAPTSKRETIRLKELLLTVGYGEAAGITIAKEHGLVFFSDDKKARQVAKQQGLSVSGTLGTLQLAIEMGKISIEEADKVLAEMIRGGYRSPIQSMRKLFESEEESKDSQKTR